MSKLKLQPRRRHLAATVTIALAAGFIALVILTVSLLGTALKSQVTDGLSGMDAAVVSSSSETSQKPASIDPAKVAKIEGVEKAFYAPEFTFTMLVDPAVKIPEGQLAAEGQYASITAPREGYDLRLLEGTEPQGKNEVVVDEAMAKKLNLSVGSTVHMQSADNGQVLTLKVTGINRPPLWQVFAGYSEAVVDPSTVAAVAAVPGPDGAPIVDSRIGVKAKPGVSEEELVSQLKKAGYDATTATQLREDGESMVTEGMVGISTMLSAFIIIALATSTLVVANSFAVTMAQRRRSFALARALGATRGQAMATVVRDALLVGIAGSFLGVAGAYGLFWGLLAWGRAAGAKALPLVPEPSIFAVLLPIIAGLVLALAASIAPAIGALKVTPLEALRPIEASHGRGIGLVRTVLSLLISAIGIIGLGAGVFVAVTTKNDSPAAMGIAVLGGIVLLIGVLFLLPALMRPLMRFFGKVASPLGKTSARFAGLNAARHPKRTATTVSALVIGAGLMAMMATGAATGEKTVVDDLTSRKPVDIVISAPEIPSALATKVDNVKGIEKAAIVESAELKIPGEHKRMTTFAPTASDLDSLAQREDLSSMVKDGELLIGKGRAAQFNLEDGSTLTTEGQDGTSHTLTVRIEGNLDMSLVTPETLDNLGVAQTQGLFAKLAAPSAPERESHSANQVLNDVYTELSSIKEDTVLYKSAEGIEREMYTEIINILLTSTIVLLAVAVLVALVGVANTLSLSVVERTGENALLRALGTSRGQVQGMLAWEGIFIALAGALIGIALGVTFGLIGVRTLIMKEIVYQPVIPWTNLLIVLGLAVLAGLLASVIPGRVASKTHPAQALAQRDE